jgi:hypothetical protein
VDQSGQDQPPPPDQHPHHHRDPDEHAAHQPRPNQSGNEQSAERRFAANDRPTNLAKHNGNSASPVRNGGRPAEPNRRAGRTTPTGATATTQHHGNNASPVRHGRQPAEPNHSADCTTPTRATATTQHQGNSASSASPERIRSYLTPFGNPPGIGLGETCDPTGWTLPQPSPIDAMGKGATLGSGWPIGPETARRLACDAGIIPLLIGSHSEPLDVGRLSRSAPPALRRALVYRDGGCRFPQCDRPPEWTDAHHVRHWVFNGPTALANMILLCRAHHVMVHEHGWHISLDPVTGVVSVSYPNGHPFLTTSPRGAMPLRGAPPGTTHRQPYTCR